MRRELPRIITLVTGIFLALQYYVPHRGSATVYETLMDWLMIVGLFAIVLGIVGGLFVLETLSVIVQVVSFKLTGKRVFRMAPLHHHFEQKGWNEATIVVRFWSIAVFLALIGLSTLKLR